MYNFNSMELHSLYCADVQLRNCSLTHWSDSELESKINSMKLKTQQVQTGRQTDSISVGTIFRLGEQKWNDCAAGEAKIGEKQSKQSTQNITLYNVYFSKKVYAVHNGPWGKASRSWGICEYFCVSFLTVCMVIFNCKFQKNGQQDVLRIFIHQKKKLVAVMWYLTNNKEPKTVSSH